MKKSLNRRWGVWGGIISFLLILILIPGIVSATVDLVGPTSVTRGGVATGGLANDTAVDGQFSIGINSNSTVAPYTPPVYLGFTINPQTMTGAYASRPPFISVQNNVTFDASYGAVKVLPTVDRVAYFANLSPSGNEYPSKGEWTVPWAGTHYYAEVDVENLSYAYDTTHNMVNLSTLYPSNYGVSGLKPGKYTIHAQTTDSSANDKANTADLTFEVTYGNLSIKMYDYQQWVKGNLVPITSVSRGSKVHIEGSNTDSPTTYLWLTGKGLPTCGSIINPTTIPVTSNTPTVINATSMNGMDGYYYPNGSWYLNWDTSPLALQTDTYVMHAASINPDDVFAFLPPSGSCFTTESGLCAFANCPGCMPSPATASIAISEPSAKISLEPINVTRCCCPGYPCGSAESPINIKLQGNFNVTKLPLQIWMFGNNQIYDKGYLFSDDYTTMLDENGYFEIDLNKYLLSANHIKLCDMDPGTYYVIVQTPYVTDVGKELFDVTLETSKYAERVNNAIYPHDQDPNRIYVVQSDPLYWSKVFPIEGQNALSGYEAFSKLNATLSQSFVKDKYYVVTFTLRDNGCNGNGSVDFLANPTTGYTPLNVQFTDISTFNGTSWNWNFGDGTNSTEKNPLHTYTKAGSYTISLDVSNGTTTKNMKKYDYIRPEDIPATYHLPQADFTYTPKAMDPMTVQFIDQSSASTPLTYLWNFGDGTNSTEVAPAHNYTSIGNYTVNLFVTDNFSKTSNTSQVVQVPASPAVKPNISFHADRTTVWYLDTTPIKFYDDTVTTWADSWQWDFGDGSSSSLRSPEHKYTTPGRYTVTLRASNVKGEGSSVTKKDYINVQNSAPVITANASPTNGTFPLTVNFQATATVNDKPLYLSAPLIKGWYWDFGDTGSSTQQNPEYVFEKPGIYNVWVSCELFDGNTSTMQLPNISVGPLPYADFYWEYQEKDSSCCYLVKFTNTSIGTAPMTYLWNFGDGANSTEENPTHRFKEVGYYNVSLTVTDANGKVSDPAVKSVQITAGYTTPTPTPTPTPDPGNVTASFKTSMLKQRTIQFTDTSTGSPNQWGWTFGDGGIDTVQNPAHSYDKDGEYLVTLHATNTNTTRQGSSFKTVGVR